MRVVIVEDCALIRTELARRVSALPGFTVSGVAAGEDDAVRLILDTKPDAVLLDPGLSPGSGLKVLYRIRSARSAARVAVLTDLTGDAMRAACITAGADAYFDKNDEVDECLALLHSWQPSPPTTADRIPL